MAKYRVGTIIYNKHFKDSEWVIKKVTKTHYTHEYIKGPLLKEPGSNIGKSKIKELDSNKGIRCIYHTNLKNDIEDLIK